VPNVNHFEVSAAPTLKIGMANLPVKRECWIAFAFRFASINEHSLIATDKAAQ
jgi:hypothetical protein